MFLCWQIGSTQSFTNNAVLDYKRSSSYINNYQGPVKSAYRYYIYIKEPIPFAHSTDSAIQNIIRNNILRYNRSVLGNGYYNLFDSLGRLTESVRIGINRSHYGKSEPNYKTASIYSYDEQDWNEKNKIKLKKRQTYPVNDYNMLVKLNHHVRLGYAEDNHLVIYEYNYELDEKCRVSKEVNYRRLTSSSTEAEYIYDDRNNVKRLNIRTKQNNPKPFHFLDTETPFCPDLHIAYEYDDQDRMTQITYYGCKDTLAFERYVYHPEKEYVTERTRFIKSSMRGVAHVTKMMVFYHNENGDITEKKYVRDYPSQYVSGGNFELPESTYYKYEYDQYNNWVKCYIYMEGKPEDSEPTAIAQRDLEYYES